MTGHVYNIMKRTRHRYHYAVRCAKRRNTETIKSKLAENMSSSKDFWKEVKKIDPTSRSISNVVDQAVGPEKIADIFLAKYEKLFNSVPTNDTEVDNIHSKINAQVVCETRVTANLVRFCVGKLKPQKDDGNHGFKSDHLINGSSNCFTLLSIMFNAMLIHGYNPEDLLLSTIISIPKDCRGSMNASDNYRGISLTNSICKLFDYIFIELNNATNDM